MGGVPTARGVTVWVDAHFWCTCELEVGLSHENVFCWLVGTVMNTHKPRAPTSPAGGYRNRGILSPRKWGGGVGVVSERGRMCVCVCAYVHVTVLGFVMEGGLEMSRCFKCLILWFTYHECIVH